MKFSLAVLCCCASLLANSQKIEAFYDYSWKPAPDPGKASFLSIAEKKGETWHRQDYFLSTRTLQMEGSYLDDAHNFGHGKFSYYYANGKLQSTGMLEHNKKHGTWISFYYNGAIHDSTYYEHGIVKGISLAWHPNGYLKDSVHTREDGTVVSISWFNNGNISSISVFKNARKNGRFKFYHKNGQLASEEMYNMDQLVSKSYFNESGEAMDTTGRDRGISFPGGTKAWQKHAGKKAYFPDQWRLVNTNSVTIMVKGTIDEDGKVGDLYVSVPFHPGFDRIALQMMMESPAWNAAIHHNRKVKQWITQAVTFQQMER